MKYYPPTRFTVAVADDKQASRMIVQKLHRE